MVDRILKQVQTAIQMAGVMVGIGVKNAQERAALSLHQDPLTPGLTLPLTPPLPTTNTRTLAPEQACKSDRGWKHKRKLLCKLRALG